ncbi:MAG: DUF523 domain-containing protein [bacterium]
MGEKEPVVLVSACLLGVACRYNGTSKRHEKVIEYVKDKRFVPVCPESLSGLPVPRLPAEFDRGDGTTLRSGKNRLFMRDGRDVTRPFLRGSSEAMKIARLAGATKAVLKDRSPSCGVYEVYNHGSIVKGVGCFTALLILDGIGVLSEKEVPS